MRGVRPAASRGQAAYYGCASCFRLNIGKNDLVTFYDGDDLTAKVLGQHGGSKSRFKLYTSTADVTIQFQSDPATNVYGYGNGFVVHFFGETWRREYGHTVSILDKIFRFA